MPGFKKAHSTVLNRNVILFLFAGVLLGFIAYSAFSSDEIGIGLGLGFFAVLLIAAPIIGMPWGYRFDSEGVSAKYLFFPQERYLWKNVYSVRVVEAISENGRPTLFIHDYKLDGDVEGKPRRYMNGTVCKTWRTKRLIEKYWDGTIEGYWHDEVQTVKKWWHKRTKQEQNVRQPLTDEVLLMERNARACVKQWTEVCSAEAMQYDLELRTHYVYITEDLEEYRSRPHAAHTYTAVVDICHPNETVEDQMVTFYVDLLRVRVGKKAYRGIVNKQAEEEFRESFSELMTEIKRQGFDAYVKVLHRDE